MIWRRLYYLPRRSKFERELAEAMSAHQEEMGGPRGVGNTLRLREEAADIWGWGWLEEWKQDVTHGVRVFRRSPSFTITAVAVLALGIGLNLALFQILNGAFIAPLKLRDPETLVRLFQNSKFGFSSGVNYNVAQFIKTETDVFTGVVFEQRAQMGWRDTAEQVAVRFVSANYFDEFGASASFGRLFHDGEDARASIVVSEEFWRSHLAGDPAAVGSKVFLNGRPATIAGIASFYGVRNSTSIWAPIENIEYFYPGSPLKSDWHSRNVDVYARLRPGGSLDAAKQALITPIAELGKVRPELEDQPWIDLSSGANHFRRPVDDLETAIAISLLMGIAVLVFSIACANLASLMVSHLSARAAEFQMRANLGAGRARVLRQLLTESSVLVAAGLIGGWFAGYAAATLIAANTGAPFEISLTPDWRLAAGASAIGWLALLIVGLVPALRTIRGENKNRMQRVLVGVQVTSSCVLLLTAGMLARKFQDVATADLGFQFEDIAVLEVSLSQYGIKPAAAANYWAALRDNVASDPRLRGVALATTVPLGGSLNEGSFDRDAPGLKVVRMTVDAPFFSLFQIPLLSGRTFQAGDTRENAVIVSRRLAERMYGSPNVVGKAFPKSGEGPRATIIGVAADAKLLKITATNTAESYSPMMPDNMNDALLMARVDNNHLDALRAAANRVNPAITPAVHWMRDDFESRILAPKLMGFGAVAVGLLALSLTSLGISALVAYSVSLRTREIGIRMALGARAESVLWLIVRGLTWPVVIGASIGAFAVLGGLSTVLQGEPFFVDSSDPLAIAGALTALIVAALGASLGPAARALRIDPSTALREQ
ncbi:MAG: FtsX-like permease family protein [Acidobacteria bacterium]|nr:FtsX-like permease family protein [Acidobacteriota bacterium]